MSTINPPVWPVWDAAVFALAGVTGAALVLCAKKGKKSR